MKRVTYSMSMSLDGYIKGPDGSFDWGRPGAETFAVATDEVRGLHTHLMGRNLYETMTYWETAGTPGSGVELDAAEDEFATLWKALPKVVFTSTPVELVGNTRLALADLAAEIERVRREPGEGDIAIGGAALAAAAADAGLIDEYRIRVFPVLVGGGTPFFARGERFAELDLREQRTLDGEIAYLRYAVIRAAR
ncbi:dihydrofolate reductase family protein [Gordonia sp. VNK21]|uniref:dihydrofolate reductase family protein n=1 Tax=Gordonia sp. VNK21 TaxID=3382483 RepID=UPI0038D4E700